MVGWIGSWRAAGLVHDRLRTRSRQTASAWWAAPARGRPWACGQACGLFTGRHILSLLVIAYHAVPMHVKNEDQRRHIKSHKFRYSSRNSSGIKLPWIPCEMNRADTSPMDSVQIHSF